MILEYTIGFLVFTILQALFINGVHFCFEGKCVNDIQKGRLCSGNIFYKIAPGFIERNKNEIWAKPVWACVRCMSSVYGTITFWPAVIFLFGFQWWQMLAWVFDMVILVSLTYYIYQKI